MRLAASSFSAAACAPASCQCCAECVDEGSGFRCALMLFERSSEVELTFNLGALVRFCIILWGFATSASPKFRS